MLTLTALTPDLPAAGAATHSKPTQGVALHVPGQQRRLHQGPGSAATAAKSTQATRDKWAPNPAAAAARAHALRPHTPRLAPPALRSVQVIKDLAELQQLITCGAAEPSTTQLHATSLACLSEVADHLGWPLETRCTIWAAQDPRGNLRQQLAAGLGAGQATFPFTTLAGWASDGEDDTLSSGGESRVPTHVPARRAPGCSVPACTCHTHSYYSTKLDMVR